MADLLNNLAQAQKNMEKRNEGCPDTKRRICYYFINKFCKGSAAEFKECINGLGGKVLYQNTPRKNEQGE